MEIIVAMEITAAVHVGETAVVTGTAEGAAAEIISAARARLVRVAPWAVRSEEHTSELQSLRWTHSISFAVFCL